MCSRVRKYTTRWDLCAGALLWCSKIPHAGVLRGRSGYSFQHFKLTVGCKPLFGDYVLLSWWIPHIMHLTFGGKKVTQSQAWSVGCMTNLLDAFSNQKFHHIAPVCMCVVTVKQGPSCLNPLTAPSHLSCFLFSLLRWWGRYFVLNVFPLELRNLYNFLPSTGFQLNSIR